MHPPAEQPAEQGADLTGQPAGFPLREIHKVLVKTLASHARAIEEGRRLLAAIEVVYAEGGRLLIRPTPMADGRWITGRRSSLNEELEELTVQVCRPGPARRLAAAIKPGFVGVILVVHAAFRYDSVNNLMPVRQNALLASLVMLDGTHQMARRSMDDNVTEFPHGPGILPWQPDCLVQLLYALDAVTSYPDQDPPGDSNPGRHPSGHPSTGADAGPVLVMRVELPPWAQDILGRYADGKP